MKTNNLIQKKILVTMLIGVFVFSSCQKYLDVAPEVGVPEIEIYGTFPRFQGFVENMYQCMIDFSKADRNYSNWNWSNDVFENNSLAMQRTQETGNYKGIQGRFGYMYASGGGIMPDGGTGNDNIHSSSTGQKRSYWEHGYYAIKQANIAIQKISMMEGTQEEKDLILGQAYFFRAFYHFQIMTVWGGIPYLDKYYSPNESPRLPRLTFKECALKVNADLEKALELLPLDWDKTVAGQRYLGNNRGRVTKGVVYAYMGWNYLWLASPLVYGDEPGNTRDSDKYDVEYAKKAAIAFNELIKIADQGYYSLYSWADYYKNFWRTDGSTPRGEEWIWGNPNYSNSRNDWGEQLLQRLGGALASIAPVSLEMTNEFGMANGLPLSESGSGFNAMLPWSNRDPRFYYNITVDRDKILFFTTAFPADTYANYWGTDKVGGIHRSQVFTGFSHKKFLGLGCNNKDNKWSTNYFWHVPYMRLANAYLYYAEATNEGYGGPNGAAPGGLTAKQAINKVRNRVIRTDGTPLPDLDASFLTTPKTFRDAVRNEINVETAFEGHRWFDLRRWHLHHLPEYRYKSALNFDKNWTFFTPKLLATQVFEEKHYWYPFRDAEVSLYPEFYQNPGW